MGMTPTAEDVTVILDHPLARLTEVRTWYGRAYYVTCPAGIIRTECRSAALRFHAQTVDPFYGGLVAEQVVSMFDTSKAVNGVVRAPSAAL